MLACFVHEACLFSARFVRETFAFRNWIAHVVDSWAFMV
jgi:hypothetical protein